MTRLLPVLLAAVLCAASAGAHESHGTWELGNAVVATFAGHDGAAAEGWAYTVLDPDGEAFARGMCDARGRAVFVPDRAGDWKVRAYAPDGHGGEVTVTVDDDFGTATAVTEGKVDDSRGTWIAIFVVLLVVFLAVRRRRR